LKLELQELKNNPAQLNKEVEKALQEANEKIRSLETKNKSLIQNTTNLEIPVKNTDETKQTNNKIFFCDSCQLNKQGEYIKRIVDAPFEPRLHGRTCYLCPSCAPYTKEVKELDIKDNHNQLHD
jgi:DNA repair exonuclease SbcCD ATPase subunit